MPQLTMPRKTWYAAYRESTREAAAMSQDPAWAYTSLRQDHLATARTTKAVLDAHPAQGAWDGDENITADVPRGIIGFLAINEYISDDFLRA